jgi:hypothetical protein
VSRALATGDLDDDGLLDAVILRRAGPPAVWRGLGGGGETLQVAVQGPAGNPDGVGATVRWRDGQGLRWQRVRTSAGFQAAADPRPVFAWRGAGSLEVELPDGRVVEQPVAAPGRVLVDGSAP